LHIDQALACIDWQQGPVQPVRALGYPCPGTEAPLTTDKGTWQQLVNCPYFHLEYVRQSEVFALGGLGQMQVLLVLHGRGQMEGTEGVVSLVPGDTLLLPASQPRVWCQPEGATIGVLLASLPTTQERAVA
jgi:mannose-6-phosphate isomerase class I